MATQQQTQQHLAPELLTPRRKAVHSDDAINTSTLTYSADGKFLFQREAHVIRVLNTKNGQLLHECIRAEAQPIGALARTDAADAAATTTESAAAPTSASDRQQVTALALHPHNALQLIAAYDDGKVLVWDFCDEKILQEFDAKASILWMDSSAVSPSLLLLVVAPFDDASKWSLIEFSMKKKRRTRVLMEQSKLAFQSAAMQSYVSTEHFHGDFVVITAGMRVFALRVAREQDGGAATGRNFTTLKYTHVRAITCVAVHPLTPEFVIGDEIGQLHRYHGTNIAGTNSASTSPTPITAKMHWHAHAVSCVGYSTDGNFLVSGGEECVFVTWHLESGRRAYLPRRSAPLTAIATRRDGSGYAIALADHVLFQYNHITKEEEWHALGLARSGEAASVTLPSRALVFDPITKAMPLNGLSSAGVLQFYDPYKDRVLQSVVLTERNQVTRTEDEAIPQILAEQLAFSPSGMELATLHATYVAESGAKSTSALKSTSSSGDDQSLRFWTRRENGSFFVNTAIDAPHGRERVTSMAFSPSTYNDAVVTGDARGEFKLWKKTSASADAPASWSCQSVVQFRDAPITAVAFAADGSLLAVAYGHLLTLWDVATNALRHVISSADGSAIQDVAFLGKTSPYVVLTTREQVQVWNLLRLELWWCYDVPAETTVRVHPHKAQFLVALETTAVAEAAKSTAKSTSPSYLVLVFDPESPVPVDMHALDVGAAGVWSVHFHPTTSDIVVLDGDSNVWRIGDHALEADRRKDAVETDAHASAFAAMFTRAGAQQQLAGAGKSTANKRVVVPRSAQVSAALFDAPAHVLPSMTALYRSFMDTMLPKARAAVTTATTSDDQEQDESGASKKKKKSSKKRKKHATGGDDSNATMAADGDSSAVDATQKRMKLLVEKELANPALQQQTYSKLLDALRKRKQQPAHAAAK